MMKLIAGVVMVAATLAAPGSGMAQTAFGQAVPGASQDQEQDSLRVYFASGSARVAADQKTTLDQAARLFRDGSPIVMIVAGAADTVGAPNSNLDLSVRRAQAVVDGLVARGIPAERLQLLGRGTSELPVDTGIGVDSRENRVVEISWR